METKSSGEHSCMMKTEDRSPAHTRLGARWRGVVVLLLLHSTAKVVWSSTSGLRYLRLQYVTRTIMWGVSHVGAGRLFSLSRLCFPRSLWMWYVRFCIPYIHKFNTEYLSGKAHMPYTGLRRTAFLVRPRLHLPDERAFGVCYCAF